jgi:hypothetical protein
MCSEVWAGHGLDRCSVDARTCTRFGLYASMQDRDGAKPVLLSPWAKRALDQLSWRRVL